MKEWSKSDKIKAFISPKTKYLIKFFDNNGKPDYYKGGGIIGIYCFL